MHGIICLWSGAIADIPEGWAICDGTKGTPDLHQRFIIAADDLVPPGTTGGDWSHDHTANSDNAIAYLDAGTPILNSTPNGAFASQSVPHNHPVNVAYNYHIPQYYALAYIMKL